MRAQDYRGSLPKRRHHHRLNGMHPVFRLVKHNARRRFKHLVRHFHSAVQIELFRHLLTQRGLVVMERRQTVQELHVRVTGQRHHLRVHLIPAQQGNPLGPLLFGLAIDTHTSV